MSMVRVMSVQVGWTPDKEDNLRRAIDLIERGIRQYGQADLICLPEFFYESPTYKKTGIQLANLSRVLFCQTFSRCAREHGVNIVTGTFPQRKEGRLYNTCLAIDRQGKFGRDI